VTGEDEPLAVGLTCDRSRFLLLELEMEDDDEDEDDEEEKEEDDRWWRLSGIIELDILTLELGIAESSVSSVD